MRERPTVNRDLRRMLEAENAKWPRELREVPRDDWPPACQTMSASGRGPHRVLRSRDFLVSVYDAPNAVCRLSIQRTTHNGRRWDDGISWDDLQRLKGEAGYSGVAAVEVFPPDCDVVNVANMRHLWILAEPPAYMWHGSWRFGR